LPWTAEHVEAQPEDDATFDCLRRHCEHSSGFLMLNAETSHYSDPRIDGFVAYRPAGRRDVIQLCGPVAAPDERCPLLRSFLAWAAAHERRVTAVQLTRADVHTYLEQGFTVNQLGASYSIDLTRFSLSGRRFKPVRSKLKRAARRGVTVRELSFQEQREATGLQRLDAIDRAWLRGKGALARELAFMVGEREGPAAAYRRVFLASDATRPLAYATYSPCFGSRAGWLYDLTRRHPDAPAGTIELIFVTALERFVAEGCGWLHLGHTPMVQLDAQHAPPYGSSAVLAWLLRLVGEHGKLIYPARSQEQYKLKWAPHAIEPEYMGFFPHLTPAAVWRLLRLTRAV
jgi:lysylphosphatidylglycerol synthetase-like protein (DUF2156 family)